MGGEGAEQTTQCKEYLFSGHPSGPSKVGRAAGLARQEIQEPRGLGARHQPRLLEVRAQVLLSQEQRPDANHPDGGWLDRLLLLHELQQIQ